MDECKPLLPGKAEAPTLELIFKLLGSPNEVGRCRLALSNPR